MIEAVQEGNKMRFFIPLHKNIDIKPQIKRIFFLNSSSVKFEISNRIRRFFDNILEAQSVIGYPIFTDHLSKNIFSFSHRIGVDNTVKSFSTRCDSQALHYSNLKIKSLNGEEYHYFDLCFEVEYPIDESTKDKKFKEYTVELPFSSRKFGSLIKNLNLRQVKCLYNSNFSNRKEGEILNISREGYYPKNGSIPTPTFTHKECFILDKEVLTINKIKLRVNK